jgi:hypothetical protein
MDPRHPVIRVGAVVARRELATSTGDAVLVEVGVPVYVGDGWDWACPYRIEGPAGVVTGQAHGIDGLQALQLVSGAIRAELERSGARLLWLGADFWQAGFPPLVAAMGESELEEALRRQLDEVTEGWLASRAARRAGSDEG